ncbi:MAG: NAD(P)/FAD-dependent oxidoreductase [Thermoplasmatales archaeon]|nr:MAG: NAD(P)/FAD-dependent oxidoreductase [Thermoplasmatales archaeon]
MHYVIIGNGGAGISALQAIRSVDKKSFITIISREKYPAYSPCSLPNLIGGKIDKPAILRFDKEFYDRLNVKFIKNTEIIKINPKNKEIKDTKGKTIKFDKLLIAVGAKPITPREITGLDLSGVHVMGTLDSCLGILDHIKKGLNQAIVVGGGFMGVETATMLNMKGIKVTIVEMLPHILSRMIDTDMSKKVEEILKDNCIELLLNNTVKSVNGVKTVTDVSLGNKKLACDMVVLAIGVLPNIDIVKNTGIKTNKGIIVNSRMQTNKKDIFAAGDITEVWEQIEGRKGSYAIWPNAIEQGRIAGLNMAGEDIEYSGAEVVNVLDIFNTPVVAMGRTSQELGNCKVISRFTPQASKKILLKNNKILGLQFIGSIRNAGIFYSLMKRGADVSDILDRLLDDNFIINPDVVSSKMIA